MRGPLELVVERLGVGVEVRASRVVLEAGECSARAVEVAVEEDVADHAALARDRVQREEADAGQLLAVGEAIEPAEELVAAADREHRCTALDRSRQLIALRCEVARDQRLLAVLAAADVQQIVRTGLELAADAHRTDVERALDRGLELTPAGGELVVLPTYTAMLELQRIVSERGLVKPYWERT